MNSVIIISIKHPDKYITGCIVNGTNVYPVNYKPFALVLATEREKFGAENVTIYEL